LSGSAITTTPEPSESNETQTEPAVEIILFHRTHWCASCIATGQLLDEVVHTYYKDEVANGTITYPCSTQVLIALLTMVAVKADIVQGLVLMLAYRMALGAPIPFIASGAVGVKTCAEKTAHIGIWFKKAAGVLLVAFGLYYLIISCRGSGVFSEICIIEQVRLVDHVHTLQSHQLRCRA